MKKLRVLLTVSAAVCLFSFPAHANDVLSNEERLELRIQKLEAQYERAMDEMAQLTEENRQLRETLDNIRSQAGGDEIRPS